MSRKCRIPNGRGNQVLFYIRKTFMKCRERGGRNDNVANEASLEPDDVGYIGLGLIF
jgi:hypothetical protein